MPELLTCTEAVQKIYEDIKSSGPKPMEEIRDYANHLVTDRQMSASFPVFMRTLWSRTTNHRSRLKDSRVTRSLCEQSNKDLFFLYEDRPKIGLIREFPEKQMLRLFDKNSDPEPIYFSGKEDADREITVTAPVTNGPSNYKIKFDPHDDETWPEGKGVYALCWRDGAAYVGRGNVITRLSDHQDKWWYKPGHISHGLFWPLEDKAQRKELEEMIIETSQPLYNKQLINGRWVLFMEGEDE